MAPNNYQQTGPFNIRFKAPNKRRYLVKVDPEHTIQFTLDRLRYCDAAVEEIDLSQNTLLKAPEKAIVPRDPNIVAASEGKSAFRLDPSYKWKEYDFMKKTSIVLVFHKKE